MKTKDYTEKVLKHRKKPELALPVNEVHSMLKTEVLQNAKLDIEVSRYLTAILEYISMEILKVIAFLLQELIVIHKKSRSNFPLFTYLVSSFSLPFIMSSKFHIIVSQNKILRLR